SGHVVHRLPYDHGSAGRHAHADHRSGVAGEPPARHPDDGRGPQLSGPLRNDSSAVATTVVTAEAWEGTRMAEVEIGRGKSGRGAYGLDETGMAPSRRTRDPEEVSVAWQIDAYRFEIPLVVAPMDSVVSPQIAITIGRLGGLAVLDLEGLWTRYESPEPLLA